MCIVAKIILTRVSFWTIQFLVLVHKNINIGQHSKYFFIFWLKYATLIQWKERNVLFNDSLNTFYLQLYGVRHMVKDHSHSQRKSAAATWATLSD